MIALLRESTGKRPDIDIGTVQYVYGRLNIPGDTLGNWLGVDNIAWWSGSNCYTTIGNVLASSGISPAIYRDSGCTKVVYAYVYQVWVKANINETDYLFDPAFKSYTAAGKIDIGAAMSYNQGEFISAASSGAEVGSDYVRNLNEANLGNKLSEYSSNLVNAIRSQHPNKDVKEIISGRSIIQSSLTDYPTILPFPVYGTLVEWSDIPDAKNVKLIVRHGDVSQQSNFCKLAGPSLSTVDINQEFYTHDITGKRLTFTHSGTIPELRLDGSLVESGNSTTVDKTLCILIDHPYSGSSGDQWSPYKVKSTGSYAIVSSFGGVSDMLLQKRQKQLDNYLYQGLSQTSESVMGETLNIMGITWLKEVQMSSNILSSLAETVAIRHHDIGVMAQETGYYIDVRTALVSILSRHNIDADKLAHFKTSALISSAFEHGVLEQLMGAGNASVSTIKLFQVANSNTTNNKVFHADSSNFSTGSNIKSQLVNYSDPEKSNLQTLVNNGYSLVLPQNGQLVLNSWRGEGYISKKFASNSMSMQMAIGGGYFGGYCSVQPCDVNSTTVANNTTVNQLNNYTPVTTYQNISNLPKETSCKPVDMAGGAEVYENTDIALDGNTLLGLRFSRFYNSSENLEKRTLGYGWTHNYDNYLSQTSHGDPVLGRRQPVDAAALITQLYVTLDVLKSRDDILGWMVASLSNKWAVDRTIDNAVTVHLGGKVMEFIKLPDGSYAAPPGITTRLIKNEDNTYTLKERFGAQIDFNSDKKIFQIKDADGNTMTFTYNGDKLQTVRDAFNRTLTLGYTGDLLTSVADSEGRSVIYGYDANNNLTTYTDPESKPWSYTYDDPNHPHRMTSLTNPLTVTTATLTYDSLGRVKTQTFPRQSEGTATHNFYFSGYRNMEEVSGAQAVVYHFDDKGRLTAQEDQLGNETKYEYDGQNHKTKVTNPRNYETIFQYDANNNLTKMTNALLKETSFNYDAQFHLTDTIDPLNNGAHIEYDDEHHLTLDKSCVFSGTTCNPVVAGDGNEMKTSATYYANGFTQTTTDARGTVATLTYDAYGNPQTTKVGAHPVLTTSYNSRGWMNSLTDQVNTTTTFDQYNNRGQLKLKTDPLGKTTSITYYDDGNLWTKTDRNNNTVSYTYTPTGKPDTITYPDASTVHFTYDQYDQLVGMQEAIGNSSYGYDAVGRLTSQTDANGFAVAYGYDEAGNLTSITYPGNKTVSYAYDALNRLQTVTNWLSQTATYNYDDAGRLTSLVNFNGTITTYSYDNANRLISLDNKKSDATTLASYSFTLDANGNRTGVVQNEPLTVTVSDSIDSYEYNAKKNRLLTAGADSFAYNDEGQLNTGYGAAYIFDYEHRLTTAGTNQYSYDGAGNRVQAVRDGATTRYIYDASGNLLAEADGLNNITKYYIHGLGLMAMVTPADQVYTYHFNAVGSTIAMSDSSQAIVNKYSYDVFGKVMNQDEQAPQPFKFVGQHGVMTEPNGLYYMRARYYDPEVGRFISEDPIGFGGGDVNLSVYVSNNPVLLIDPSGLLSPFHHLKITYQAARDSGYGIIDSAKMAWNVMAEDRNSTSKAASDTAVHAMVGVGSNGRYESAEGAMNNTNNVIMNGSLPAALHAGQDMAIHNFESMEDFHGSAAAKHIYNDFFPGDDIKNAAYQNTRNILNNRCK